jgi:hypothetical protein
MKLDALFQIFLPLYTTLFNICKYREQLHSIPIGLALEHKEE